MRCEECLAVIEEYFDGELGQEQSEPVASHLAACAECADAFEALGLEQEIYARHERGVEVTPALWQAVRSRIVEEREIVPAPLPLVARLRRSLAGVFAAPRFNPAFASSFALVALCAFAGLLWYAHTPNVITPRGDVASNAVGENAPANVQNNTGGASSTTGATGTTANSIQNDKNQSLETASAIESSENQAGTRAARSAEARTNNAAIPVGVSHAPEATGTIDVGHPPSTDDAQLLAVAAGADDAAQPSLRTPPESIANSQTEDPEVARHIEQAQLMLRSFRNASEASPSGAAASGELAYEKQLSKKLLNENIVLRRDAESGGNRPAQEVLSTLEPFLLDIANLQDKPSPHEVRSIKERMHKSEIIAALQVY